MWLNNQLKRLMRVPLREEIKALVEKIESLGTNGFDLEVARVTDSVNRFLRDNRTWLRGAERRAILRALEGLNSQRVRTEAMLIVMGDTKREHPEHEFESRFGPTFGLHKPGALKAAVDAKLRRQQAHDSIHELMHAQVKAHEEAANTWNVTWKV